LEVAAKSEGIGIRGRWRGRWMSSMGTKSGSRLVFGFVKILLMDHKRRLSILDPTSLIQHTRLVFQLRCKLIKLRLQLLPRRVSDRVTDERDVGEAGGTVEK
jgi:hypothetical protein